MEAQSLPSLFYSNSTCSSTQSTKKIVFAKLPSSLSSSISQNLRRFSFQSKTLDSLLLLPIKRLECRSTNTVEKTDSFTNNRVRRKRLAVFVSGGGSNFRSIHEASLQGSVHGDIVLLVTNNQGCGGAEYARDKEIPIILFPKTKDRSEGLSPFDLAATLRKFEVDFILLAGYLKLIPSELIRAFPRSILNIHPSLLPAFGGKGYYGMKVHKAVIASGARYSGPSVHFVDEHYDTGRILAQKVVPVLANDTAEELAARVLHQEHKLYVEVTAALCEDRIIWREDGVPLIQSKESPNEFR